MGSGEPPRARGAGVMAVGREPGGPAADHRTLPQRYRTTGLHHGAAQRDRAMGSGRGGRAEKGTGCKAAQRGAGEGTGRRDRAKGAWRGVHGHGTMRRDGDIAPYRNGTAPRDQSMGMGERDHTTGPGNGNGRTGPGNRAPPRAMRRGAGYKELCFRFG